MKIIFFLFILKISAFSSVVINEFMPVPEGNEPEWIELFNNGSDNVKFIKFYIADATSLKLLPDFELKSGQFAVITKDTSLLKSIRKIPDSAILIQLSLPILNNSFDNIILKTENYTIDSVYYHSSFGENGKSIERINPALPAVNKENLSASISLEGATCGYQNSIVSYERDVAVKRTYFSQNGELLNVEYDNLGEKSIEKFSLKFFVDLNKNNIFENDELCYSNDEIILEKGLNIYETFIDKFILKPAVADYLKVKLFINSESDLNNKNDTLSTELYFSSNEQSIVINEIMYDVDDNSAEFVELFNKGTIPINLKNSEIKDDATITKIGVKIYNDFIINPDSYAVVVWDSSFFKVHPELINSESVFYSKNSSFNLNQGGDFISISDANGFMFDSLSYSNKWHTSIKITKNTSLEKINYLANSQLSSSWATSIDISKSTPAKKNSVFADIMTNIVLSASPNPFSPTRSDKQFCVIGYNLPFEKCSLSATIYDTNGKKIKDIANNINANKIGSLVWDGKNESGFDLAVGRYVLLLSVFDINSDNNLSEKIVIVIGS